MLNCTECGAALINSQPVKRQDGFIHELYVCTNCKAGFDVQITRIKAPKYKGEEMESRKMLCRRLVNQQAGEA